jgi:glycosyltransferase involved in cell wall biosynthesis
VSVPAVSVVLPVHNGERFLAEAVESILKQSLAELELIVVDDGSTDRTAEILARFSDPRLEILRQPHEGLVPALTRGVSHAQATYVARMDADDVSERTRLERQVESLERNSHAGMTASWVTVIDDAGRTVRQEVLPLRHEDLLRRLLLRNPFQHGSVVMRREALERAGAYRADYGANEDYDLWRRLARVAELSCVPEPLYRYRLHVGTVTATDPSRLHERERLRDELWRERAGYDVGAVVAAGNEYRKLDPRVHVDHVADQRALAREAFRRRELGLAARAAAASVALRKR